MFINFFFKRVSVSRFADRLSKMRLYKQKKIKYVCNDSFSLRQTGKANGCRLLLLVHFDCAQLAEHFLATEAGFPTVTTDAFVAEETFVHLFLLTGTCRAPNWGFGGQLRDFNNPIDVKFPICSQTHLPERFLLLILTIPFALIFLNRRGGIVAFGSQEK